MGVLLVALACFGVPHGATDHLVGQPVFQKQCARTWLVGFVAVYLAMMGGVVLAWNLAPSLCLAAFLLMSVVHWGLGDAEEDLVPPYLYYVEVVVRGSIPILLPSVAFHEYVAAIFGWLVGKGSAARVERILEGMRWGLIPFVLSAIVCLAWHVTQALPPSSALAHSAERLGLRLRAHPPRLRHSLTVLELVVLSGLATVTPPLQSFLIYFCCWHSFRHIMVVASSVFSDTQPRKAMLAFSAHAAPFTIGTLVLAWWSAHHFHSSTAGSGQVEVAWLEEAHDMSSAAQVVFIGLSAVTVPHMIITELSQVRQKAAGSSEEPYELHS